MSATIIQGDVRANLPTLPDESVQTIVTSPPYLWLRDYGVDGQIGLESTVEEHVATIVGVFREARRVLRSDGTLWLNVGDVYNDWTRIRPSSHQPSLNGYEDDSWGMHAANGHVRARLPKGNQGGLKRKDLIGLPWEIALALRRDGWYLRRDIIWEKPNAMPESVRDRPTTSHEYLFLLSKSPTYYYDATAIEEPTTGTARPRGSVRTRTPAGWNTGAGSHNTLDGRYPKPEQMDGNERWRVKANDSFHDAVSGLVATRNKRSVWTIASQKYDGAHYATFPEALVEPCVLAGSSERGGCPACGAPWKRLVEVSYDNPSNRTTNGPRSIEHKHTISDGYAVRLERRSETTGWESTCACDAGDPVPCAVLDPFAGTGTTGVVALRHGRRFVGIELNPASVQQARERIVGDAPMFNRVEVA